VFIVCDPSYQHPNPGGWTNLENIEAAICDNKFYFTGEILGQKPKGSFTKKRITSCSPEKTISGTKTVTFQDYNSIGETLEEYTFWDNILNNTDFLYLGFVTCDDRFYMVSGHFDVELDEVIEDTKEGTSYFDGTVTFQEKDLLIPDYVEGLNALLASYSLTNCYGSI